MRMGHISGIIVGLLFCQRTGLTHKETETEVPKTEEEGLNLS